MERALNRKLVAIMFTDMVGYTALMQRDEKLGIQKRNRHRTVLEEQHKKYQGEIIQYFGDGTLSIFSNSCDAVECAVEIQKALKAPLEVPLRIGIHVGNVVVEKDGILGDAVNKKSWNLLNLFNFQNYEYFYENYFDSTSGRFSGGMWC